jgi:predicted nuclease of predicted toxin-antitoxin system
MSAISVKSDENLGRSHVEILRQAGYFAERVHEEGLSGVDDTKLWKHVCDKGHFFITLDLDFSDVRRFPPGSHPGLLLLRPRNRSRDAALVILRRVLKERPLETLTGCLRDRFRANIAALGNSIWPLRQEIVPFTAS